MKTFALYLLYFLPFLPAPTICAQGLSEITKAISAGDAATLGSFFDDNVEVAVLDKEGTYSKSAAISVVRDFFTKHKPSRFSQVHQGTSKGKVSEYCIGDLQTTNGSFRVYIYMRVSGNRYTIQELRFDQ
ncbi:MAG: hypothetical protein RLY31_1827 [Bacteroidota bacterium]